VYLQGAPVRQTPAHFHNIAASRKIAQHGARVVARVLLGFTGRSRFFFALPQRRGTPSGAGRREEFRHILVGEYAPDRKCGARTAFRSN